MEVYGTKTNSVWNGIKNTVSGAYQCLPIRGVSWIYLGSGLLRYILMRVCRQSGLKPFTRPSSTLQLNNISYMQLQIT